MKKLLIALTMTMMAALTAVSSAGAAERITFNPGGSLIEFITKYNDDRQKETKFILDGLCISACTFITGLIEDENVCATERGKLAFHSAWVMTPIGPMHSKEGTRLGGEIYPDRVADMLKARGFDVRAGDEHPDLIYIKATELYKACN